MQIDKLVRNSKAVLSCLKELPNASIITTKACCIQIPTRFGDRNLAEVGEEIFISGIYVIIMDGVNYAVSSVNARMRITPNTILKIKIEDIEYYEFHFDAGEVVFPNINLVQEDTLIYYIFNEVITKGNIPWFLNYDDMGRIFDTAKEYAGVNIAENQELTELIIAMISRDRTNRMKYYRTSVTSYDDLDKNPPAYVPLNSVIYSATSTLNKLAGSYMSDGITSTLVDPSQRTERIESLLRA